MADSSAQTPENFAEIPFPYASISVDGRIEAHNSPFVDLLGDGPYVGAALEELFTPASKQQPMRTLISECLFRNTPRLLSGKLKAGDQRAKLLMTPDQTGSRIFIQVFPEMAQEITDLDVASQSETGSRHTLDFLSGLSHHLRTPVNGVLGIADLLAETKLSRQQATYVDILSRSCNALVHLVDEIQSITLLEQGTMQLEQEDAHIADIAERSLEQFAVPAAQKEIATKIDLAAGVPDLLQVDKSKLEQILFILLDNAFRYTDQGTVTLSIDLEDRQGDPPHLQFQIADNGIGIAKDRLPSLFTGGVSSETSSYGNTGLGLILCHKLVELMQGTISVQSSFGRGSTFTVSLPVEIGSAKRDNQAGEEQASSKPTARKSADDSPIWHILIAEDNPVNQMLFKSILERFGHRVTVVGNGQEAVAKVQLGFPFDIILMDISMPVMDGLEATAMIRSLYGDVGSTPILALTAHAMEGDREKFINAGMDGYQSKPVDPMALQKAIADVIGNHAEQAILDKAIDANVTTVPELSERQASELMSSRRSRE